MNALTAEQQLDIVLAGLRSQDFWMAIGQDDITADNMNLYLYKNDSEGSVVYNMESEALEKRGGALAMFSGTRAECIAEMAAWVAARRLET